MGSSMIKYRNKKPSVNLRYRGFKVPRTGLEPVHPCGYRILSPACLPIPPPRHVESEKRDSNPRPRPWQGRALPAELFSQINFSKNSEKFSRKIDQKKMVRMKGLEPPRGEAPDPKSGMATNYITSASIFFSFTEVQI